MGKIGRDEFPFVPTDAHDLPLARIVTPDETIDETIDVPDPPPPPDGIDWVTLPDAALDEMPVLADLRRRSAS